MKAAVSIAIRAIVVLAAFAGLFTPSAALAERPTITVQGKALLDEPLVGALVVVVLLDEAGKPLRKVAERTGAGGRFEVQIPQSSRFRVSVTGGFCGKSRFAGPLFADVDGYDPDGPLVYVNAVTTLASLHRYRHPGLSIAGAEADVKTFLGIPANYSTGFDLDNRYQQYFDHGQLRALASGSGPCGEVSRRQFRSYLDGLLDALDRGEHTQLFTGVGEVAPPSWEEIIDKLAEGITDGFSDAAFGWMFEEFLNAIGIGSNSEIVELLDEINDKLNNLEKLVDDVLRKEDQTQAEIISATALNAIAGIEKKHETLNTWTDDASLVPPKFPSTTDADALKAAILDQNVGTVHDLAVVQAAVLGAGPEPGAIFRWDKYLKTTKPFYFHSPDDRLVKIFEYYKGVQVIATYLIIDAIHGTTTYPLPPNTIDMAAQTLDDYKTNLKAQEMKLNAVGVPDGTVLHYKQKRLYLASPRQCAPYTESADDLWKEGCEQECEALSVDKFAGFDDWRLPESHEMDDVVSDYTEARNRGETGPSVFGWLAEQGIGGFADPARAMFTSTISGTTGWYWEALTDVGVQYTCDSAVDNPGATNGCSEIFQRWVPSAGAWCISDKGGVEFGGD